MFTKFLYMRLSMEDKEMATGKIKESSSISSQRECIQSFLLSHPELGTDFTEIIDDGCTGTNDDRPGLQFILQNIPTGKVEIIIVKDLSRFFRNYIEAGRYLELVFPLHNVRFISVNDGFDSKNLGESIGGPELAIRNLLNQMYSIDTSKKVKSVMDMKKRDGKYFAGTAPYGYKKNREEDSLEVDDEAAHIVKNIFQWAADGVSITEIAQRLNADNIPTPSAYMASKRGKYPVAKIWKYDNIRSIIRERVYTGDSIPFRSQVEKVGSNRTIQIPLEDRMIIPRTHEPIVSHELFDRANQATSRQPKSQSSSGKKPDGEPERKKAMAEVGFPVPLVCGCCGLHLMRCHSTYICKTAQYDLEAASCSQIKITLSRARKAVITSLTSKAAFVKKRAETMEREVSDLRNQKKLLEREIATHKKMEEASRSEFVHLYEQYASGQLSKEEFVSGKENCAEERSRLRSSIHEASERNREIDSSIEAIVQAARAEAEFASDMFNDITDEVIKKYVKRITVYPDAVIDIEWQPKGPFAPKAEKGTLVAPSEEKKCVVPT